MNCLGLLPRYWATVSAMTVVLTRPAPNAVTVMLVGVLETTAVLSAVRVSVLVPTEVMLLDENVGVIGLVLHEAVTPVGNPDTLNVTLPAKEPPPVTVKTFVTVAGDALTLTLRVLAADDTARVAALCVTLSSRVVVPVRVKAFCDGGV